MDGRLLMGWSIEENLIYPGYVVLLRNIVLTTNLGCPIPPDFLWGPMGSTSFMRLSLTKAAHGVTDSAAHRKSGVWGTP
jgi:hypothetical protein